MFLSFLYKLTKTTYFKLASNTIVSSNKVIELILKFDTVKIRSLYWILEDNDPCYDLIFGRKIQKEYGLYLVPDE